MKICIDFSTVFGFTTPEETFVKFTVKEVAKGVKQVIRSPDLLTAGVKRISLLITLITLLAFKMELLTLEIAFNNFFRAFIDIY